MFEQQSVSNKATNTNTRNVSLTCMGPRPTIYIYIYIHMCIGSPFGFKHVMQRNTVIIIVTMHKELRVYITATTGLRFQTGSACASRPNYALPYRHTAKSCRSNIEGMGGPKLTYNTHLLSELCYTRGPNTVH
jgi:hypothetical protein